MKLHKLFLTALLMLIPMGAFAQDSIYKTVDFSKPDPVAKKMVLNYILEDNKQHPEIYKELKDWGTSRIFAYRVDLNDDGINEVIGIHHSALYMGNKDGSLFILQKTKNGYKDLSYMIYTSGMTLYVLNEKSNGYRKLLGVSEGDDVRKQKAFRRKIEYVNGKYEYIFR